jgi:hypothetical protein
MSVGGSFLRHALQILVSCLPKPKSLRIIGSVGLKRNDISCPAQGDLQPIGLVEEERGRQNAAADYKIAPILWRSVAIMGNPRSHLLQRARAIRFAKRLPGQRAGQRVGVGKTPNPAM